MLRNSRQSSAKGFFVKATAAENDSDDEFNITVALQTVAKRIGFTLDELNEMSTQTFLDIVSAYAGSDNDKPRKASQKDIDELFG